MARRYPDGVDDDGAPLEEKPATVPADAVPASTADLTGAQIDEGLRALGLPLTGKVDDRRARLDAALAEGTAEPSTPAGSDTTTTSKEP